MPKSHKDANDRPLVDANPDSSLPKDTKTQTIAADWLVDAVGQAVSITNAPLLTQMVKDGVAKTHPVAGIALDPQWRVIDSNGAPQEKFYALGNMAMGQNIHTFSSITLARISNELAATVCNNILAEKEKSSVLPIPMIEKPTNMPEKILNPPTKEAQI